MEAFLEKPSTIDLNLVAHQIIDIISDRVADKIIKEVKNLLEEHSSTQCEISLEYHSIDEACKLLNVCRTTLHNWRKSNYLIPDGKCGKSPLYSNRLIEEFLKRTNENTTEFLFDTPTNTLP